jgi:hypothetical protein
LAKRCFLCLAPAGIIKTATSFWFAAPTVPNPSQETDVKHVREHWPYCYSGLFAGARNSGGAIYGSSDRHATYPATNAVSPHDYAATILHALGIPASAVLHDRDRRPRQIYAGGPITDLFA